MKLESHPKAGREEPDKSYLILCTPRSGSYLLCDALTQTGVAGEPQEFFGAVHQQRLTGHVSCSPLEYVTALLEISKDRGNAVFGAKAMWPQILDGLRPRVAGDMHPTHSEIGAFLSTLFPSLHYIRLSRENKLLQAISYLRAEQTGVWSVPSAMPSRAFTSADQPRFNRRRISELMLQIQAEEDEIDRLLACTSNPAITITYEDLARDYHDTVARVLGFLELRSIPPINTIKPRLRRQTDLTTSRWVRRFLEQK